MNVDIEEVLKPNAPVKQISNPKVWGITTGRTKSFGATVYVEIAISENEQKFVPSSDLVPVTAEPKGIEARLQSLEFGTLSDLARILTYHKISSNLSNVYYAMQASRTDFHAYQFKAVYKFIDSLAGRILIADEVGLGKTIEAGLIWLETQARENARRLLVVCPPMLLQKWKRELRFRFNTRAEVLNAKGLITMIEDFQREGEGYECAVVCSLNSIRVDSVQQSLRELEATPYKFDLVVVDEAHHMRNPGRKSHSVGRILSDLTEAMVFLTATPIQLGNVDLFRILNLLDPDQFAEQWQFDRIIDENEPIISAQNLLRSHPPRIREAREELSVLEEHPSFRSSPYLMKAIDSLSRIGPRDRGEIVDVGLLLERMNLLSSHISRTRKREVKEWRVIREASSLTVRFTTKEKAFYDSVTRAVQDRVAKFSTNMPTAFALMMPQRQMASCIPAMIEHYRGNFFAGEDIDAELVESIGLDTADDDEPVLSPDTWLELEEIILGWGADDTDSKFEVLLRALRERFQREPGVKVIVFSYFKKTLAYLQRRLSSEGIQPTVIHGDIAIEERADLIERFKTEQNRRILLSSEVGGEGIDLQFCRILINYDLPWNPMKVEQRIGRLDRLGQKADKISILNFAIEGTIEERILHRLYDRIGIFEKSLGDLEPILGELSQQLSFDLLRRRLTPDQEIERIEQTLNATENRRKQEEELTEQSSVFLGTADYIMEQISRARDLGRRITQEDIKRFVEDFFESKDYHGTHIRWEHPNPGFATIDLSNRARSDLLSFTQDEELVSQTRLCSEDGGSVLVLDTELAQEYSSLEMLTHFHPLVQWIRSVHRENPDAFVPTSAVQVDTDLLPAGDYLIVVQFWTYEGIKNVRRIESDMAAIDGRPIPDDLNSERLLRMVLESGTSLEFASRKVSSDEILPAWERCNERILSRFESAFADFDDENSELRERRLRYAISFGERKEESLRKAIATMEARGSGLGKIAAFQKMIDNRRRQTELEIKTLRNESRVSKDFRELIAILCRVVN